MKATNYNNSANTTTTNKKGWRLYGLPMLREEDFMAYFKTQGLATITCVWEEDGAQRSTTEIFRSHSTFSEKLKADRRPTPEERYEEYKERNLIDGDLPLAYITHMGLKPDTPWGFCKAIDNETNNPFFVAIDADFFSYKWFRQYGNYPNTDAIFAKIERKEEKPVKFAATTITKKASPFSKPAFRK